MAVIDLETLEQERVRILRERIEINERLIHKTGKKRREAKAVLRDLNAQYEAVCRKIMEAQNETSDTGRAKAGRTSVGSESQGRNAT